MCRCASAFPPSPRHPHLTSNTGKCKQHQRHMPNSSTACHFVDGSYWVLYDTSAIGRTTTTGTPGIRTLRPPRCSARMPQLRQSHAKLAAQRTQGTNQCCYRSNTLASPRLSSLCRGTTACRWCSYAGHRTANRPAMFPRTRDREHSEGLAGESARHAYDGDSDHEVPRPSL